MPAIAKGPIAKGLPNPNPYYDPDPNPNPNPNPRKYKKTVYCRETAECGSK